MHGQMTNDWTSSFKHKLLQHTLAVLLGISLCIFAVTGVYGCKNCTSEGIILIQEKCKNEDTTFIKEQTEYAVHNNRTKLCSAIFEFFFCVGRNIPECLDRITSMYAIYYSSPYDCHPDENTNLKLQEYAGSVECGTSATQTTVSTEKTTSSEEMTSFAVNVTADKNKKVGTNSGKKSSNADISTMILIVVGQLLYNKLRSILT